MASDRIALGKVGEDLACAALHRRGYAILDRRYRSRFGELDIVARDGPTVVFVEVKTRRGGAFGSAADAVTPLKQRQVVSMAHEYLTRHALHGNPCRFDVVAVTIAADGPVVEVFPNAFDAP